MNLIQACEIIKKATRGEPVSKTEEIDAFEKFNEILMFEDRPKVLEQCILDDKNWDLHISGRFFLLYKAKAFGVSSREFLMDYYGYVASYIDTGEVQEDATKKIEELLKDTM